MATTATSSSSHHCARLRSRAALLLIIDNLSRIHDIGEVLLIVSHDGYFPEMDEFVRAGTGAPRRCQGSRAASPPHAPPSPPPCSHRHCPTFIPRDRRRC
uniref:Uncharacterized protein n=2 Tax=Oryza TaxID=4527 RepID=Q6Z9R9_ORYSJ|nr:hypothetical protein [Oryza sativa Japonica Group]